MTPSNFAFSFNLRRYIKPLKLGAKLSGKKQKAALAAAAAAAAAAAGATSAMYAMDAADDATAADDADAAADVANVADVAIVATAVDVSDEAGGVSRTSTPPTLNRPTKFARLYEQSPCR